MGVQTSTGRRGLRRRPLTVSLVVAIAILGMAMAGCSGSDADDAAPAAASTAVPATPVPSPVPSPPAEPEPEASRPLSDAEIAAMLWPASIAASDQSGDGTSITIDAVTLPTAGFIVIHRSQDGSPGQTLAVSELLEAGEHQGLVVDLSIAVAESEPLLPMLHIDVDGSGIYEEMEPPGFADEGLTEMAIVAVNYEVG